MAARLATVAAFLLIVSCGSGRDLTKNPKGRSGHTGCVQSIDCPNQETCFQGNCTASVEPPTDSDASESPSHLLATPQSLVFGTVAPGTNKRLAVELGNDSQEIATLSGATLAPPNAPFALESLGSGPFWVRSQNKRTVFVTFAPSSVAHHQAVLTLHYNGGDVVINLAGN